MSQIIKVAIAGNPNSGKTTIFNNLTGARQHVGNYPGVTVEKKEGSCRYGGHEILIADLPGTYSLNAYSEDEIVARNFIMEDRPDVVINVIDASNLERNLYLTVQLIELGVPLLLAFNMSDMAEAHGAEFDLKQLSDRLGAPIVKTVGYKKKGMNELLEAVISSGQKRGSFSPPSVDYGRETEAAIADIGLFLDKRGLLLNNQKKRWTAIKLLENDSRVLEQTADREITAYAQSWRQRLAPLLGENPEIALAERRYGFISGVCQESVLLTVEKRHDFSDKIDKVVLNKALGLPIFLMLMYLTFYLTFKASAIPMDWIEKSFLWLGNAIGSLWVNADNPVRSLLVDGIIAGVGGVLVFLPNIALLFFAIAVLEDSGYMGRAAFIMDRFMHRIGLHGKSFIPMLIGFGCTVPAIMATRTLDTRRDRLTLILVLPLISCGARLSIYALIIPAFFPPAWRAAMLWLIYFIGILLAIIAARILRSTVLKGENMPLVIELPPYLCPSWRGLLIHAWERSWLYIKKAGTIILGISIVMWFLTSYPKPSGLSSGLTPQQKQAEELSCSAAGRIGKILEPVLKPMGFDWRIGTALIGAFAAKEVFIAQLGIIHAVGRDKQTSHALANHLREEYSPLVGFCIMIFMLISMPCAATLAVTRQESGSWKWAMIQFAGLTILAYLLTVSCYQIGRLLIFCASFF